MENYESFAPKFPEYRKPTYTLERTSYEFGELKGGTKKRKEKKKKETLYSRNDMRPRPTPRSGVVVSRKNLIQIFEYYCSVCADIR